MRKASAEKDTYSMTIAETNATDKAAAVAAQDAHVAPEKAPAKKAASQKKGAPEAKKTASGAKRGAKAIAAAPKKATETAAKTSDETAKADRQPAPPPAESKGAKILELIARSKGLARRNHEGHRPAGAPRTRVHLDRWQEARCLRSSPRRTKLANVPTRLRSSPRDPTSPLVQSQRLLSFDFSSIFDDSVPRRGNVNHRSHRQTRNWCSATREGSIADPSGRLPHFSY
jgi:hypothetical protein